MQCGPGAPLEPRKGGCTASAQQTLKDTEEPVKVLRGRRGMGTLVP